MSNILKRRPPVWADRLLERYCPSAFMEEIQGDLHEAFHSRCKDKGIALANVMFVIDVFHSVLLMVFTKEFYLSKRQASMFRNHISITVRKLVRNKFITAINVAGLSVSLAGALLICLYIRHELSFDNFHAKADRIYRVYCDYVDPGQAEMKFAATPPVFAPAVKREVGGIEEAVRLFKVYGTVIFRYQDKLFSESDVYRTDDGFFNIFSATFLAGNPHTALTQPYSVVLSKSAAEKYFGSIDGVIGRTMDVTIYKNEIYTVTAIVDDFPSNSHFHFSSLLSIDKTKETFHPHNWLSHDPVTYVLFHEGSDVKTIEERIRTMTEKTLDPIYAARLGKTYAEHKQLGGLQEYKLQSLKDVHLHSGELGEAGSIVYVYLFATIGVLLICIACFNYVNLSTARASSEVKGTGMRKVLGATRAQIRNMFLIEAACVFLLAAFAAIMFTQIILVCDHRVVRYFVPFKTVSLEAGLIFLAMTLVLALISGIVPARLVQTLHPAKVLKGEIFFRGKNQLRQFLVAAQFTGSMALIMCTILISRQLDYMQTKTPGFDRENLLVIKNIDKLGERKKMLKQAIANEVSVLNVSLCYNDVGNPHNYAAFTPVELIDKGKQDMVIGIPVYIGDRDYLSTLGLDLILGHPFPPDLREENKQIILNQAALRAVGWHDRKEPELIGKMIDVNGLRYELAGIVQDYNFRSLHQQIEPLAILSHYYQDFESLMLRVKPGTYHQILSRVQAHWKELAPDVPFDYSFMDEDQKQLYVAEERMSILFKYFAIVTVVVACLGLLGLAMFAATQRIKEIGIRKVLGATALGIVLMLSRNIAKLIVIAFLIASPIAWYAIHRWLENFAYRTEININSFFLAGISMLLVALLTISFQTIKTALTNPAESLKHE